jgi:soluble lytic murein transglycosylase-like protein
MRTCVLALAALAFTQPALAKQPHRHSHHAAHHPHRHAHHVARAHLRHALDPAAATPQAFARTDATDTPLMSAPSFPSGPSQNAANRNGNEGWSRQQAAQPSASADHSQPRPRHARAHDGALDALIARHAAANGLPVSLVHRVVTRESGYNPRAHNRGALGLMQIKYATARGIGYGGSPAGLLDAETNLTYAVRYLAGAYHAAGGNANRAVAYYASGYRGRAVVHSAEGSWQNAPVSMQTGIARHHRYGRS